jgi:hypothetical protein
MAPLNRVGKGMHMNKNLLLVALMAASSTQLAFALNLSNSTATVQYAAETLDTTARTTGAGANTGTFFLNIIDTATNDLDLTGSLGIPADNISPGSDLYVRFDLYNAAFSTAVSVTDLTITTVGTSDGITQGGTTGESFVIFNITPAALNLGNDTFSLPIAGLAILTADQVSAEFSTYSSRADAINQRNSMSGMSQPYVNLVDGINVESTVYAQQANAEASSKTYVINTRTNSTGTSAALGLLTVSSAHNAATNAIYDQLGTAHVIGDSVTTATGIEIAGDFSKGTYYLDTSISCPLSKALPANAAAGALTISTDKQLATQTLAVLNTNPVLCHVVDGETKITPSTYNAMVKYVTATGASTHADELVALGSVTRSGPSDEELSQDADGDGVPDLQDAFPNDAGESVDTDVDGIGNVADTDDDNDGIPDTAEIDNGLDSLDASDASGDADSDGISNLVEFQQGTDLNDKDDAGDVCLLGTPLPGSQSSFLAEANLYTVNPGSNVNQQSFIRLVNSMTTATAVEIYAIDDSGQASRKGPVELELAANESLQFTAQDLELGNPTKGLTNKLCDGQGKWRLLFRSENDIEVMGFVRTKDGFLTGLNTTVPRVGSRYFPYFVNPASNTNQQSFLRVINTSSAESGISITAIDDEGMPASGTVTMTLEPNEARQFTAVDLESGNADKGLTGSLGDGAGKWQLNIFSSFDLAVMSMIRTKDGFLTNLSGVAPKDSTNITKLYYVNPASETEKESFIRLVNLTAQDGTITIAGIDDNGAAASGGSVTITLGANQSKQVTLEDLENGNAEKGLIGQLGDGEGRWHLNVSADVGITAMNLIRTTDGFLTNVSQASPIAAQANNVFFFNPGSNQDQRSSLRLVNNSNQAGSVTISATDDAGSAAPGGDVTFTLASNGGTIIAAQDLENGNTALGLSGSLGDGTGKWRLSITSGLDLAVQSLLDTPNGFITNLSVTASD